MASTAVASSTGVGDAAESQVGLTRVVHEVRGIRLGDNTAYDDGVLTVSQASVHELFDEEALAEVRLSCASPGDPVRIVKVLDTVEPRSKGRRGGVFPGFVAPRRPQGRGETHVLRGAVVVAAGYLPRAQEGLIDMSGPGAELSPFASTHNLVVEFTPAPGAAWEAVDAALRKGVLALASHLADAALDAPPDSTEDVPVAGRADAGGGLPRVGALTNLQTQGAF